MLQSTVLFEIPQHEIASLIVSRIDRASTVSIVSGFATPGGLATIAAPIRSNPHKLRTMVIGAATYPGFEALDELLSFGVPRDRLHVHLGHTSPTGTRKHPYARFHPMLHSKVYYMEFPDGTACAIIGSHNVTTYALSGLNGEASVLLEGDVNDPEFAKVRTHITEAETQAINYEPEMKEAYAWWTKEFIEGMRAEIGIPREWETTRTILLFAEAPNGERPSSGDQLYFELPKGIQQIEYLKTETHLFLFDSLPSSPWGALDLARQADARYLCKTLGVENEQGNTEVVAQWHIDNPHRPVLESVSGNIYRPSPSPDRQQVRAVVESPYIADYEYLFERESNIWVPQFAKEGQLLLSDNSLSPVALKESKNGKRIEDWKLVSGLVRKEDAPLEKDQIALEMASPDSGSYFLVSLRRRQRKNDSQS